MVLESFNLGDIISVILVWAFVFLLKAFKVMNEDLKATTRNNHQSKLSSVNLQVDEENWLLEAADLT